MQLAYEGGGGRIAAGGGLFAGGPFAAGLIAGGPFAAGLIAAGLFASGLNAAPRSGYTHIDVSRQDASYWHKSMIRKLII